MQQPRHIALIGPMGAGKSHVGRLLGKQLGLPLVDTDAVLEAEAGRSIPELFASEGEAAFRQREALTLRAVLEGPAAVIATGGGIVLFPQNRALLRAHATVVHLQVDVDAQLARLERSRNRPLLQSPDRRQRLQDLAAQRDPLYAQTRHLLVPTAGLRPAQVCTAVAEALSGVAA